MEVWLGGFGCRLCYVLGGSYFNVQNFYILCLHLCRPHLVGQGLVVVVVLCLHLCTSCAVDLSLMSYSLCLCKNKNICSTHEDLFRLSHFLMFLSISRTLFQSDLAPLKLDFTLDGKVRHLNYWWNFNSSAILIHVYAYQKLIFLSMIKIPYLTP